MVKEYVDMKKIVLILALVIITAACQIAKSPMRGNSSTQGISPTDAPAIPGATNNTPGSSEKPVPNADGPKLIWEDPGFSSQAIVGGIVYGNLYTEKKIQAVELATGKVVWESNFDLAPIFGADRDFVYISTAAQRLDALDVRTGERKWHALLPDKPQKISTMKSSFIIVDGMGTHNFYKIDKANGAILEQWSDRRYPISENIYIVPYLESGMQFVDINTGQVMWELPELRGYFQRGCNDLYLYDKLPSEDGQPSALIEAVDANTGELAWTIGIPTGQEGDAYRIGYPRCPGDQYIDQSPSRIVSIDAESPFIYVPVAIYENPAQIANLGAVDQQTGQIQWIDTERNYANWLGEAAGLNIYSQPEFGLASAYDAQTKRLVWENDQILLAGLIGSSGNTIVGITVCCQNVFSLSGFVGLAAGTGEVLWKIETAMQALSIKADILAGYFVYSPLNQAKLIFIDPKTGSVKADIDLDRDPTSFTIEEGYLIVNNGASVILP